MTGVKKLLAAFCLLIIIQACFFPVAPAQESGGGKLKTYIIYDDIARFGSQFPLVTALVEYLAHFEISCRQIPLANWRQGSIQNADIVVYVGFKKEKLPNELLQEMANSKRVIWFEQNIEQMAEHLNWDDFQLEGVSKGWLYINYKKDKLLPEWLNIVITQPGQNANVLAEVKNLTDVRPLVWQRDNIYFCGFLEINQNLGFFLGDILHKLIPNDHPNSSTSMLRVEDVSPLVSPKDLKAVVDAIDKYHIPFAIGVIPVGISEDGAYNYLHEKPELVKVLKEAQNNGASIILHGYTHQNEYSPKTGEGYEFWNAFYDKPMEADENFTRERIEAGIAELVRCGLIPLAFEPPHYAMSSTGYKVLSEYFNIFSGEIQLSDKSAKVTLSLPYSSKSIYLNGMVYLPENMGYYDGQTFLVENMLRNSELISDIQDGLACFFYHAYLPPTKIGTIIENVQKQGYEFLDLRQMPITVQSPQIKITGKDGYINVEIDEQLKDSWGNEPVKGSLMEKIGTIHVVVLFLIIVAFITIIFHLRFSGEKVFER